jgi:hypothetical protein
MTIMNYLVINWLVQCSSGLFGGGTDGGVGGEGEEPHFVAVFEDGVGGSGFFEIGSFKSNEMIEFMLNNIMYFTK